MKLMLDGKYFTSLKFSLIFVCVDYIFCLVFFFFFFFNLIIVP